MSFNITNCAFLNTIYLTNLALYLNNNARTCLFLDRGKVVLDTDQKVEKYISNYFVHHIAKLNDQFDKFDWNLISGKNLNIYDWASGPVTASLAFVDYAKTHGKGVKNSNIHLIDAGNSALTIGKGYLEKFYSDNRITSMPGIKLYNQILNGSPTYIEDNYDSQSIDVHFFSNMLDIWNLNKDAIASYIWTNMNRSAYIFCAGPNYSDYSVGLENFLLMFQKTGMVTVVQKYCTSIYTQFYKFNSCGMCHDFVQVNNLTLQVNR